MCCKRFVKMNAKFYFLSAGNVKHHKNGVLFAIFYPKKSGKKMYKQNLEISNVAFR